MKAAEKQAVMETDNLWIAQKILAEPERYKAGSLMREWAELVIKNAAIGK